MGYRDALAGDSMKCPKCGSEMHQPMLDEDHADEYDYEIWLCKWCGHEEKLKAVRRDEQP